MGDRISFSPELLQFDELAVSRSDTKNSLRFYYTAPSIENRDKKFIGYSIQDTQRELNLRLEEIDKSFVLSLLAALEGHFRVDFHVRCERRKKDELSRCFREVNKKKPDRVSFEEDILETWRNHLPAAKALFSELKGAFRYRHYLAHGRYWNPKLGKNHDFESVYLLAQAIEQTVPLLSSE
jgi:hypothetical protein